MLITLSKPLKLGFWLPKGNIEPSWIKFKYERLQHFCYRCGLIGHEQRECTEPRIWSTDTPEIKRYNSKLGVALAKTLYVLITGMNQLPRTTKESMMPQRRYDEN